MGLFSGGDKRPHYRSNTTPEQLDLFEQLDRTVVLCVKGGSPLIDGALHLCVTQAGFEKAATALDWPGRTPARTRPPWGWGWIRSSSRRTIRP